MELYNGKNPVAQLCGCHDLHTANGESVLKRTAIAYVVYVRVYSDWTRQRQIDGVSIV